MKKENDSKISFKISSIIHYFHIEDIADYQINSLTVQEKCLIKILSFLITNPLVLGIDNLLSYLQPDKVDLIFNAHFRAL
jgi:ABC-type lipopolysaccharide export system ATPase subunit